MESIFSGILDKELEQVERKIFDDINIDSDIVVKVVHYVVSSGEKGIQGKLALACAKLVGKKNMERHIALAAAVEILYAAILIHDEIIDDASFRRGDATTRLLWGDRSAVLLGDLLLTKAIKNLVSFHNSEIMGSFSRTIEGIFSSEFSKMENAMNLKMTQNEYIKTITDRTAKFFASTCLASAILARADKKKKEALYNYGLNLGIIFQMVDDVLDFIADEKILGKPIYSGIKERKITLPLILTYNNASFEDKKIIQKVIQKLDEKKSSSDKLKLSKIIKKYNAIEKCETIISTFALKAKQQLKIFDDKEITQNFHDLVDLCVMRRH